MASNRSVRSLFAIPQTAVYVLLVANIAAYAVCLGRSENGTMTSDLLYRSGAMYLFALERHEYWRLVAAGFLHANPLHLAGNMLCLVLWGGLLERRVGSLYFLLIYFSAVIFGNIVSSLLHTQPYLAVGASGGVSGILSALFALWILAKIDLTLNFFVANIGLNIVLGFSNSRIDWQTHLGGFIAGLIAITVLDAAERFNSIIFRCKFPEFVKVNLAAVFVAVFVLARKPTGDLMAGQHWVLPVLAYGTAGLAVTKMVDLLLAVRKGLAVVVGLLAATNSAVVVLMGLTFAAPLLSACATSASDGMMLRSILELGCAHDYGALAIAAAVTLGLTILLYSAELSRGIKDVGFIGNTLRAERHRRQGL